MLHIADPSYASRAGLAISSALQLSGSFQWGVRQSAEVESQVSLANTNILNYYYYFNVPALICIVLTAYFWPYLKTLMYSQYTRAYSKQIL